MACLILYGGHNKATSPPQTDGLVVFDRWRHLANTTELMFLSAHPSPQPKSNSSRSAILAQLMAECHPACPGQFSRFCTAHGKVSLYFTMGRLSPSKQPLPMGIFGHHLIHDSLDPSDNITQMASRSVQPFLNR